MDIRLKTMSRNDIDVLDSMHELSRTLLMMGRYSEAIVWLEECLQGCFQTFDSPDFHDIMTCSQDLQAAFVHEGRTEDALNLCYSLIDQVENANTKRDLLISGCQLVQPSVAKIQEWIRHIDAGHPSFQYELL